MERGQFFASLTYSLKEWFVRWGYLLIYNKETHYGYLGLFYFWEWITGTLLVRSIILQFKKLEILYNKLSISPY